MVAATRLWLLWYNTSTQKMETGESGVQDHAQWIWSPPGVLNGLLTIILDTSIFFNPALARNSSFNFSSILLSCGIPTQASQVPIPKL